MTFLVHAGGKTALAYAWAPKAHPYEQL